MEFTTSKTQLLKSLTLPTSIADRKAQTMPILGHAHLALINGQGLTVSGTDMETQASVHQDQQGEPGTVTVPAKKLHEIVKTLPDTTPIAFKLDGTYVHMQCGRNHYKLATLPAIDMPLVDLDTTTTSPVTIPLGDGKALACAINKVAHAMAENDVRYYLNGMLITAHDAQLRLVATDMHRMACADTGIAVEGALAVIAPRGVVPKLAKLLEEGGESGDGGGEAEAGGAEMMVSENHVAITAGQTQIISKLIAGNYPEYQPALRTEGSAIMTVERAQLLEMLKRATVLVNEHRVISLEAKDGLLQVRAKNNEGEGSVDELEVQCTHVEYWFNVNYLIDAVSALDTEHVDIFHTMAGNAWAIKGQGDERSIQCVSAVLN